MVLTVHIENYQLAKMWVCGQSWCLFSDFSHSSFANLEAFIRSDSSATNTNIKRHLSEATGSLQTKGNISCLLWEVITETTTVEALGLFWWYRHCISTARLTGTHIYDPSNLGAVQDITPRETSFALSLLTSHIAKSVSH